MDLSDGQIVDVFRIGRRNRNRNSDQVRPILVKFKSMTTKDKIVRSRRLLGNTSIRMDNDWSYEVRSRRRVLVPFLKEARKSGQFARLCGDKLKINNLIFSVEECLESIKEPVVGSEEMERNRRVLKEKIRGLVSRSIGNDISSDNINENSKTSMTRSSSDRHGMRKEATSSDRVKPMTSSEEEISTRSRNLQTRQNSCNQHFEAIPRRVRELQSQGKTTTRQVKKNGTDSGSSDERMKANSKKKHYDLRSWCSGEVVGENTRK